MIIRPAQASDLPRMAQLHAASWKDTYRGILPDDFLERQVEKDMAQQWQAAEITADDLVLLAENVDLLGFIAIWCRPDPFIDNLHVSPELQSQGIGRALMQAAAGELLARGKRTAYLWVMTENHRAIRFYEGLGGKRVDSATKSFFGNKASLVKIFWADFSAVLARD